MSEYIHNLDAFLEYSFPADRENRNEASSNNIHAPIMVYPNYPVESAPQSLRAEEWQMGYINQSVPPFLGQPGLTGETPRNELGFFRIIMTRFIILFMVQEVNKFAKSTMTDTQFKEYALVSPEEMNDFICLILYMGICKLPSYEMYWRKNFNPFFQEFPRSIMAYDRFVVIKNYFQVFDNEANQESEEAGADFTKLNELIDHFSTTFFRAYTPEKELALDENLCSWSDLGGTKLFVPEKNTIYDMNLYALCEGKSGYICSLALHSSTNSERNIDLVLKLTKEFRHKNYRVYMDNFFTSLPLIMELKNFGVYSCGTQRDVGSGPRGFRVGVKKLKSSEAFMKHNGAINCLELSDSLGSVILTNIHPEDETPPEAIDDDANPGIVKDAKQSRIVKDFNTYTVGVDLMNQMTKYYEVEKKSKKWSTKLCIHVLNIAFYNSYSLYKRYCPYPRPKPYLQYLSDIITALQAEGRENIKEESIPVNIEVSPEANTSVPSPQNTSTAASTFNRTPIDSIKITHFPVPLENRKRCVYCSKHKRRKEIKIKCSKCDVPLCHIGCFEKWHNE